MYLTIEDKKAFAYTGAQEFDVAKPTIVFIHGAAHDHSVWALQSRYFAYHGYNVLAIDLPGHGRSEGPSLNTVEAMAAWVIGLCDAVQVNAAAIVGHSMGALISLEIATRFRDRITKVALVGIAYPMQVSDALLVAAHDNEAEAWQMINVWSHDPTVQIGGNPSPGMWMMGRNLRLMERCAPGVMHIDLKACNDYRCDETAVASIPCSTLLMLGQRDMMTPLKSGRVLSKVIGNSQVAIIDGAGHSMMSEKPDAVLDVLIKFMSEK